MLPADSFLIKYDSSCRKATVAQLVEQRFRKPQVVGSSPTRGSSSFNSLAFHSHTEASNWRWNWLTAFRSFTFFC